ncbi:protein sidekick-2-like, partial [Sinocyclocheilus rhinocerous]|uniref:protein sidekick-2-like n=1 Tax=Sinocyclocheilus rhinocerous TaxID=307959 RepID=UPI0007B8F26C
MEKVVDIPCQARGVPQPDIVWYKDAVPISPAKTPRYRVLVGGSLQINGLLPDDTGMFQCFARNLAGEIQTNTYLAVTSTSKHHLGLFYFKKEGKIRKGDYSKFKSER